MADLRNDQAKEVELNFEEFSKLLDDLVKKHEGQWALLRHGSLVEIFDTVRDAHIAAWKLFSDDLFSVQEITKQPVDLGFYSYADYQRPS